VRQRRLPAWDLCADQAARHLVGGLWQRARFLRDRSQDESPGVFYTATIGAGALAPIVFGSMTAYIAATALITPPLARSFPESSDEGG